MKVILLSGSISPRPCGAPESWCLHRDGCKDLTSKKESGSLRQSGETQALREEFNRDLGTEGGYGEPGDIESGWRFDRDVHFHPCCAGERDTRFISTDTPEPVNVVEAAKAVFADDLAPVTCQCGCGGTPKGAKSRFLPGHDARYHAKAKAAQA